MVNSRMKKIILCLVLLLAGLVLWRMVLLGSPSTSKVQEINYSEFKSLVEQGKVAKVTIRGNEAYGEYKGDKIHTFHLTIVSNNQEMYKLLDNKNVNVEYRDSQSGNWGLWLIQLLPLLGAALPFLVIVLVCVYLVSIQKTLNQILQELRRRDLKAGLENERL